MKHLHTFPISLIALLAAIAAQPLWAQNILVTTGEHAAFTRLVLQSQAPILWQLEPRSQGVAPATTRNLRVDAPEAEIDISRAFQRIPRTRLSDLVQTPEGLELQLNCDCPIQAWTERPGLVVLDIGNPEPHSEPEGTATDTSGPAIPLPLRIKATPSSDLARAAGITLARQWPSDPERPSTHASTARQGPMPSPMAEEERQIIMRQLTEQVSGALSQGILDPSQNQSTAIDMIRLSDGDQPAVIPPNLRIMSVLDRPDGESVPLSDDTTNACAAAAVLDFVISPAPRSFNTALAENVTRWIGEFDQPEHSATEDLIVLYLQHGFGAEARALIENALQPITGRDLLLGFADTLEGRQSNSRLRLAEHHQCGPVGAMLAALAGAPLPEVRRHAGEIANAYTLASGVARIGLGGPLIRILLDADAIDAGRVVADTLRRTPHARPQDLQIADALLDLARGDSETAGARLMQMPSEEPESVLLRLQIALETGAAVPESALLNAEAIATSKRSTQLGTDLMAAAIELRVASGMAVAALDMLDRMTDWQGHSSQNHALISRLSDTAWHGVARQAADPDFLEAILHRTDWRAPSLSTETRTALAERLLQFGLIEPAQLLIDPPRTEGQNHMLARLHLDNARPRQALVVLGDDQSDAASTIRAEALMALGDGRQSSRILSGIGDFEAAARAAARNQEWAMAETAWEGNADATRREIARALGGGFAAAPEFERTLAAVDASAFLPRATEAVPTAFSMPEQTETGPDRSGAGAQRTQADFGPMMEQEAVQREAPPEFPLSVNETDFTLESTSPSQPGNATAPGAQEADLRQADIDEIPRAGPETAFIPGALEPNAMQRGALLLSESEGLRAALAPLAVANGIAAN